MPSFSFIIRKCAKRFEGQLTFHSVFTPNNSRERTGKIPRGFICRDRYAHSEAPGLQ
jgi:hypothetical protein